MKSLQRNKNDLRLKWQQNEKQRFRQNIFMVFTKWRVLILTLSSSDPSSSRCFSTSTPSFSMTVLLSEYIVVSSSNVTGILVPEKVVSVSCDWVLAAGGALGTCTPAKHSGYKSANVSLYSANRELSRLTGSLHWEHCVCCCTYCIEH